MKKLLLLLLFIPVLLFSQVQQVNVRNERNLSLSPEKIKVRTPISVDLYNYTHIAIVDVDISNPGYPKKKWTNVYADRLKQSPLTILNPYSYNKKLAKKNPTFLKDIKNPDWLYLSLYIQKVTDDWRVSMIVRDYKNKIIYSASHNNVAPADILYPLIGF